jgi:hypothetical protein
LYPTGFGGAAYVVGETETRVVQQDLENDTEEVYSTLLVGNSMTQSECELVDFVGGSIDHNETLGDGMEDSNSTDYYEDDDGAY